MPATTKDIILLSAGIGFTPMQAFLGSNEVTRVKKVIHVDRKASENPFHNKWLASGIDYSVVESGLVCGAVRVDPDPIWALNAKNGKSVGKSCCTPSTHCPRNVAVAHPTTIHLPNHHWLFYGPNVGLLATVAVIHST